MEGDAYPSGCVATALAQICLHNRFPEYCTSSILAKLKEKNCVPYSWDGNYNYYSMKYNGHYEYVPYAEDLSSEGKMNVSTLLYDIGKGVNMSYKLDGSGAADTSAVAWLRNKGFSCSDVSAYDTASVKSSLKNYDPVYVSAYRTKEEVTTGWLWWKKTTVNYKHGHAWVIDDCINMACSVRNKKTNETFWITDDFVHCNFGWGGDCNGYYISGIFNTVKGPEVLSQNIFYGSDDYWV